MTWYNGLANALTTNSSRMCIIALSCSTLVLSAKSIAGEAPSEKTKVIVVPDGLSPRDGTAVVACLPREGDAWELVANDGQHFQVLRCGDHVGRVLLPKINAETTFTVRPSAPPPTMFTVEQTPDQLRFLIADREVIAFSGGRGTLPEGYEENYRRGGYLSRLSTPSGRLVTDDYPPNHKHHHGLWFSWTRANYDQRPTDFWNMGKGTAGVQAINHTPAWTAGPWAGFSYRNRYHDNTSGMNIDVLEERIEVTMRAPLPQDPVVIIDLTVTQHCLTALPLQLPTYTYGGLGLRGHRDWDGAENTTFLTSGGHDRKTGNFTRMNWVHMGGLVGGQPAGTAVLCHPNNFRAPQPGRLHPKEPFFCFAPSQMGDWAITPEMPYQMRYRLIIADGAPEAADLERRWQEYAHPFMVTWNGKLVR